LKITRVDPDRMDRNDTTHIYVRAVVDGQPQSVDIACLDTESLLGWLRSRGGSNPWAEHVVLMLLGHRKPEG
jgi:hypothetical protein